MPARESPKCSAADTMSAMSALIALPRLPRLVFLSSLRNLAEKLLRPSGSTSLPVSSAAALILSACGYVFYKWYRLSHIPGPFWTPWSFFRLLARGRVYEDFPALNRKYGNSPIPTSSAFSPFFLTMIVWGVFVKMRNRKTS